MIANAARPMLESSLQNQAPQRPTPNEIPGTTVAIGHEKRKLDPAALVAGAIGGVALLVWIGTWLVPTPQEEVVQEETRPAPAAPKPSPVPPLPPSPTSPPVAAAPATAAAPPTPPAAEPEGATGRAPKQPPPPSARSSTPPLKPAPVQPDPAAVRPAPAQPRADVAQSSPAREARKSAADPALDSLRGKYVGNLFSASSDMVGLSVIISGIDDGIVTATATLGGSGCSGQYPMQGKYQSSTLTLRSTRNGGPAGDCPLSLSLTRQGDGFVGVAGGGEKVQLRR